MGPVPPNGNGNGNGLSRKGRWAKGYAQVMGIPVFPLGDRTKLPRPKSHGHLDATTDLAQIEAWWTKCPNANVAMRCTLYFVFDVDPRNGGDESLRLLIAEHGPLPDTLSQITARKGTQYFFLQPDQREVTGCVGLWDGIDIKGAKGYVVLPPSETPDGVYAWDGEKNPQDQPILPAPEWLLTAIFEKQSNDAENAPASDTGAADTLELAAMVAKAMPAEGERHDTFLAISGFLARRRCPEDKCRELIRAVYRYLWKGQAKFTEADKDVSYTYARYTQGDKVTGYYTLKDGGFPKNVLRALGDWAEAHHDQEIVDAAADAAPEDLLGFINKDRMLAQRGIEFTYGIERVGSGLQADVWIGGEQGRVKWESIGDLLKLDKTREAVATCLGVNLIPTREAQADWQHVAHSILQLARGERLSKADALRAEVQNLAATALRQSYEKVTLREDLGLLWEALKIYTPVDSVLDSRGHITIIDFPQCVYLYNGAIHVYAPCLYAIQRLRRIQGRLTLREITEGLHSAGFGHQRLKVRIEGADAKAYQCWMYVGPMTALAPYWEPHQPHEEGAMEL
jgi:hypothetical protein